MFNFYKNNDELMECRRRESIGDWYPNEAYALDDKGDRTDNPTYDSSDATAWELALEVKNIKGSNNPEQLSRLYDPTDPVYDYFEARKHKYGTLEEQIEYIAENGITAFRSRQTAIKAEYPKP